METKENMICPECNKEETKYWIDKFGCCYWCDYKHKKEKELSDLKKEVVTKGESSNEDYIICPYCGAENSNDDLYETTDTYCDKCGKEFHLEIEYDPKYSTYKKEKQT